MNIDHYIAQLDTTDQDVRCAAAGALVTAGSKAVPALLRTLRDADSASSAEACMKVLRRLGPLAYRALLELLGGLRAEPSSIEAKSRTEYRACQVLGLPALNKAAFYAEQICSAKVAARQRVAEEIGRHGSTDYAFVLTALLGDSDEGVRSTAAKSFGEFGAQLVPLLQQVRRSHLPERRGALAALAEIGWHTIEPADLALLHRFIMSKLARETPHIPAATKCLWWALPTDDQAAVLDAFGLSDPVPATVAMGTAVALENRRHLIIEECERVYVSPTIDGWTLVFGDPASHYPRDDQRIHEEQESDFWKTVIAKESDAFKQRWLTRRSRPSREERCAELSGRFGAAHWYKEADDYEWGGWCIAENGDTIRSADLADCVHEELTLYGDPHPSEQGLRAEPVSEWLRDHGFAPDAWDDIVSDVLFGRSGDRSGGLDAQWSEFQQRTRIPDAMTPMRIAERASINPLTLGPHTRMEGHGVVALTECGRQGGRHRGALPI